MAHSSLEMGLDLGMKAAAQAQQRGESEKDRKMRKLMAKEQRDFTEGQAKLQREHTTALSDKSLKQQRDIAYDRMVGEELDRFEQRENREADREERRAIQQRAEKAVDRDYNLKLNAAAARAADAQMRDWREQDKLDLEKKAQEGIGARNQADIGRLKAMTAYYEAQAKKANKPADGGLPEFDEFNKGDNAYADRIQTIDTELSGLAAHLPGHLPRMTKLRSERKKLVAAKQLHNQKYFKAAQASPLTATIRDSIDGLTGQPIRTITRTVPASSLPSLTGPGLGVGNNQGYSPNPASPRRLNLPNPPHPSANPVVPASIRGTDEEPVEDPMGIRNLPGYPGR